MLAPLVLVTRMFMAIDDSTRLFYVEVLPHEMQVITVGYVHQPWPGSMARASGVGEFYVTNAAPTFETLMESLSSARSYAQLH